MTGRPVPQSQIYSNSEHVWQSWPWSEKTSQTPCKTLTPTEAVSTFSFGSELLGKSSFFSSSFSVIESALRKQRRSEYDPVSRPFPFERETKWEKRRWFRWNRASFLIEASPPRDLAHPGRHVGMSCGTLHQTVGFGRRCMRCSSSQSQRTRPFLRLCMLERQLPSRMSSTRKVLHDLPTLTTRTCVISSRS